MSRNSKPSSMEFLWTPGFVFASVILFYRLNNSIDVLDAQTVGGGIVIGLVGAVIGIILKRISTELPFIQRIAVLIAIVVAAFFIW